MKRTKSYIVFKSLITNILPPHVLCKKILCFILLVQSLACISSLNAQSAIPEYNFWNEHMQQIAKPNSKPGWIYFKDDFTTPPEQIFTLHKEAFDLGADDSMHLFKQKTDDLGWTHYWFQQYYNNREVLNSKLVLHKKENRVFLTGELFVSEFQNSTNLVDLESIINEIRNENPNRRFLWEDSIQELNIKIVKMDSNATYFPEEKIYFTRYSTNPVYVLNVGFLDPYDIETYFIDATNGEVLINNSSLSHNSTVINTIQNGLQTINYLTEYNGEMGNFLIDLTRADNGLYQYYELVQFGTIIQEIAELEDFDGWYADHLWAGAMAYDAFTHHEPNNLMEFPDRMIQFLSSLGNFYNPVTEAVTIAVSISLGAPLELYGHEWGHAIFHKNVGLLFDFALPNFETTAISEAISDICGVMVEFYAEENYDADKNGNWLFGDRIYGATNNHVRNLANPKESTGINCELSNGQEVSKCPDTYQGEFWLQPNTGCIVDGAYVNGMVITHWFYILSNGKYGVNDHGYSYTVCGIGKENAFQLLLYAMSTGLFTNNLDDLSFYEFRSTMISAAEVYFGLNTFKYNQVVEAFNAVGLYENGIQPTSSNAFSNEEITNDIIISNYLISGIVRLVNNSTLDIVGEVIFANNSKLIVENGSTVYIRNAELLLGQNAEIIVEPGGNLIIEKSVFEYGSACEINIGNQYSCYIPFENTWNGITFKGNGVLNVTNSTFKNAKTAIYAGAHNNLPLNVHIKDENEFEKNIVAIYINGSSSQLNNSVEIDDNTIFNPIIAEMLYYTDALCGHDGWHHDNIFAHEPDAVVYLNNVNSATFTNNKFRFPQLSTSNPEYYNYGYAYAEPNLVLECTHGCRNTVGLKAVSDNQNISYTIVGNDFLRWDRCMEIKGFGRNTVTDNTFERFDLTAVKASGHLDFRANKFMFGKGIGLNLLNPDIVEVRDNTFEVVDKCIYSMGSGGAVDLHVSGNSFGINQLITKDTYGVHLYGTNNFIIEENNFSVMNDNTIIVGPISGTGPSQPVNPPDPYNPNFYNHGVVVNNTGGVYSNYLFDNRFMPQLAIGVQTEGDNSGLKLKCNTFGTLGHQGHAVSGMLVYDGRINAEQGSSCFDNESQAGNEWMNSCTDGLHDNVFPRRDIILGQNAQSFNYWAHAFEVTTGPDAATTVPNCNNLFINQSTLTVCPSSIVKTEQSCAELFRGWFQPPGNGGIPAHISQRISELLSSKAAHVQNLMNMVNQLVNKNTQRKLVNDIRQTHHHISRINNQLVKLHIQNNDRQAALQLMEAEEKLTAKMRLYEEYLVAGDADNASRVLDEVKLLSESDYLYDSETDMQYFENIKSQQEQIAEIERDVLEEGRTISQLKEYEKYILSEIKESKTPVSARAEVILSYNGSALIEPPISKLPLSYFDELINQQLAQDTFNYNLTLSPNPSSSIVEVCFNLPETAVNSKLKLIDMYYQIGNVLEEISVNQTDECKTFNVVNKPVGTYRIHLEIDGQAVAGKHLLIVR